MTTKHQDNLDDSTSVTQQSSYKVLKPIKTEYKGFTKKVLGFDIETHGKKNNFVLATLRNEEINETFRSVHELKEFLDKPKFRKYIIVATNLAFDFLGCFMEEPDYWSIKERNGIIYSFTYYQKKDRRKTIKFFDTLNYFKASVEGLGKILGVPKMEHPKCFMRKPRNEEEFEELATYCSNDSYISYLFFKKQLIPFLELMKAKHKSTQASEGMEIFRRNYLNKEYNVESINVHQKVFKAYYGGRVETFKRGTFNNVSCYDFNSLYPSVMRYEYPDPNSVQEVEQSSIYTINNYHGVSYIEGVQSKTYIPLLPVRLSSKLLFPTGSIRGFYTHIELREAVKHGFKIKKVGEGVIYTKTCTPFKTFVEDLYALRLKQKANKDPLELMTKLTMNSLYGKFAFNYMESSKLIHKSKMKPDDYMTNEYVEELGDYVSIKNTNCTEPTNYSFPIWSAYVTAYGRLKLYEYLSDPELQPNICYCDTDSIFLKDGIQLPSSNKLGDLDHEYEVDHAIFVRAKFYMAEKVKIKGVTSIRTPEKFMKFLIDNHVVEQRFVKYRSAVRSQPHHKNGKLKINQVIQVEKTLDLEDTKRNWSKSFNHIEQEDSIPLEL